jgi:hypothetical protein
VTSFHHQPEAQHPKSSAIHKLPADYPIYWGHSGHAPTLARNGYDANDPLADIGQHLSSEADFRPYQSAYLSRNGWRQRPIAQRRCAQCSPP